MALGTGVDLHDQLKLSGIARWGSRSFVIMIVPISKLVLRLAQVSEFHKGEGNGTCVTHAPSTAPSSGTTAARPPSGLARYTCSPVLRQARLPGAITVPGREGRTPRYQYHWPHWEPIRLVKISISPDAGGRRLPLRAAPPCGRVISVP